MSCTNNWNKRFLRRLAAMCKGDESGRSLSRCFKDPGNKETFLRKCLSVCARTQHLLRKQNVLNFFRNILISQQMFSRLGSKEAKRIIFTSVLVCSPKKHFETYLAR